MTTKIMNAIKKELNEKNLETIMKLKTFLDEKIDGDTEQLMSFIDEFIDDLNIKTKSKGKKKRGPSYYNYWIGTRIAELKKEGKDMLPKDRMKAAGDDWKIFKETADHDIQKKEWERKTAECSQDESSNDDEKSVKSSSNEDDVDEIVPVKKSKDKKKPKPKSKKPKSKSKKSQDVSDDSEDNNSNSSSDENDKNVLSIIDADTESDEE